MKDGTSANEIAAGQKQDAYLKFSIPEDIDESLFPIEYKIYTKKLYAVEPGVRLETTGANDWYYVYTDQIFSSDERVIQFKTNTTNDGEDDVKLEAELFNPVKDLAYSRKAPITISPTISGNVTGGSSWSSWKDYTVKYKINNTGTEYFFKCGKGGAYSTRLENVLSTDKVYFYYYGQNNWHCEKSVEDLINNGNIEMTKR